METNESILTRSVVGLQDRRILGKVSELRVDCDSLTVNCFLIDSAEGTIALPFNSAISVGDTFITVETSYQCLTKGSPDYEQMINGFKLIDVDVYSRSGNKLSPVKKFVFDPVFGTISSLELKDGSVYPQDDFVFFSEDFVFVDDHSKTASEFRAERGMGSEASGALATSEADEPVEDVISDEDRELMDILIGKELTGSITSADGEFTLEKGTELTEELVEEARKHGELLTLTLSV